MDSLTEREIQELIDVSVAAIYERAYNEALDDVMFAVTEVGTDFMEILRRIRDLRKSCFITSSEKQ